MDTVDRARQTRVLVLVPVLAVALGSAACDACRTSPPASAPNAAASGAGATDGGPSDATDNNPDSGTIGERVTLRTDGWTLVGDYVAGPGPANRGPTLLLVHQLGSSRREWEPLVRHLRGRSPPLATLAIDLRGHGDSTTHVDGTTSWQAFGNSRDRWMGLVSDVAAAAAFLSARNVASNQLVLVGSSIGSSAVLHYAARENPGVAGLVMVSPGARYHGLDTLGPMRAFARSGRPALLIAGEGDTDSARTVQALWAEAGRGGVSREVYGDTGAHGVALAAQGVHPEMWARIERFAREVLYPEASAGASGASQDAATATGSDALPSDAAAPL